MSRRLAVLALAAALLAGCGEKHEPAASQVRAGSGTVDLAKPASTTRAALAFGGHVQPPSSRVTLRRAGAAAAPVVVANDGSFRARALRLRRGANRFELEGRSAGMTPWKVAISIVRR
jgi:hypothetical protein